MDALPFTPTPTLVVHRDPPLHHRPDAPADDPLVSAGVVARILATPWLRRLLLPGGLVPGPYEVLDYEHTSPDDGIHRRAPPLTDDWEALRLRFRWSRKAAQSQGCGRGQAQPCRVRMGRKTAETALDHYRRLLVTRGAHRCKG
jgi:hypothetical protein